MAEPVIRVEGLEKHFQIRTGGLGRRTLIHAVNGVSLEIAKGETLGIVGESGCGKSTLGRTILKVLEPDAGRIWCDGTDITGFSRRQMRPWRQRMQMIFQDPYASLNPRFTVGELIAGGIRTSFPEDRDSASASPGRWRWNRSSSSVTSRFRRWTSPSRRRS